MSDIGYVRIFVPAKVTSTAPIRVRALITHPMDPVERDASGNVIEKNYIYVHTVRVFFDGEEILTAYPGQSVSTNPLFAFFVRIPRSGDLKVVFEDTADSQYSAEKRIQVS
jgi:hypothetical protein